MKTQQIIGLAVLALVAGVVSCSDGPNGQDVTGDVVDVLQELPGDTVNPDNVVVLDVLSDRVEDVVADTPIDTAIEPGKFGSPCLQNSDCEDGFCVEGVDGLVCTKPCVTECPDDWLCRAVLIGGDLMSLCVPGGVYMCRACTKNAQCADGLCIPIGDDGSRCTRECSDLMPCPGNYNCEEVTDPETMNQSMQCVPKNGSCTCKASNDLEERVCENRNTFGICLGYQTCHKDTGWTECTGLEPSTEICDGIDNDCNRVADDNPPMPEGDCFNTVPDVGACKGAWVCRGEDGWDCVGPIPLVETCNYIDDDCDGDTDEIFKGESGHLTDLHNCGQCGVDCEGLIPFAEITVCDDTGLVPECVVTKCFSSYVKIDDHTCRVAISSVCVPCDDDLDCGPSGIDKCLTFGTGSYCGRDCTPTGPYGPECPQGYSCHDFGSDVLQCIPQSGTCECTMSSDGMKRLCEDTNTFGTCQGTEVCDGSVGWVNCTARTPSAEVCDGIDDDCDGIADNSPTAPVEPCENLWTDPTTNTEYSCGAEWVCTNTGGGKDWVCPAKTPAAETCNNVDDNCDGLVDEDFKLAGTNKYNNYNHCGACNVSCAGMVPHATMMCDASGAQPQCLVESCAEGWWKASDLSCLAFPESLCMACSSDAACQIPGDVCLAADGIGNSYCLWDCSDDALRPEVDPARKTCPEGYYCRETNDLGLPLFKCFPNSGACDCIAGDAGNTRACVVANGFGRCYGEQSCAPAAGWTSCNARTPAAETCNTQDDDCNGLVDEIFPSLGATCYTGIGECQRSGSIVCNDAGDGVKCTAVAVAGDMELCDGLDNDCDNLFDEDFTNLGKVCFAGSGECLASGFYECMFDGSGTVCNAVEGTGGDEVCDQKDNDCDDLIDEDYAGKGRVCAVGVGECFANGVWVCTDDTTGLRCDGIEGISADEVCDGLDNDCDIQIDELWPEKNTVCVVGDGACRNTGVYRCTTDKSGIECSATEGTAFPEVCDGIDNDCDGHIDEDWVNKGRACQLGSGECLGNGVWVCTTDLSDITCDAVEGMPLDEACDGRDNDCDGDIDEDFTNLGRACSLGVGECMAAGVYVCTDDHLTTECNAEPGAGMTELCDGIDNDCDTLVDETWTNKGTACQEGTGACLSNGVWACMTDKSDVECTATPGSGTPELCDGIDNDCDNLVDETFANLGRSCLEGVGACLDIGVWECTVDKTGVECDATPATGTPELCDGIDNDCDGSIDETWTNKGTACQEGVGACLSNGVWTCTTDFSGVECNAIPGSGSPELCDGIDNDCDNAVDETWTNKGTACQEGTGACLSNGVWACMTDKSDVECTATPGSGTPELCDGIDNDCDNLVDETFANLGRSCQEGVGACLDIGVWECTVDKTGVECDATPATGTPELCDGIDNDCDGSIDETFANLGRSCLEGVGACLDIGVWECTVDKTGVECDATPATGTPELCDGIDNDCDNAVDETWTNKGTACQEGTGACLSNGVWTCTTDFSGVECNAIPGSGSPELCDGIDNDCDNLVDETWTNKGTACQEGTGACLSSGVWACMTDKSDVECTATPGSGSPELCDGIDNDCDNLVDETWTNKGTACQEGTGACLSNGVWACMTDKSDVECTATPGTGTPELCDGIDNDCDSLVDETFANLGRSCQEGVGECLDIGVWLCTVDKTGVDCSATPAAGTPELCDGLDNDCDGLADELWSDKGRACQEGLGECLANGVYVCNIDQDDVECNAVQGMPLAEECDGLDNNCDGGIDETWPEKGSVCQSGVGECLANGVWVCTGDFSDVLCNAVGGLPVDELCDGLDNDCDTFYDEDFPAKGAVCFDGVGACQRSGTMNCLMDGSDLDCSATAGDPVDELCDDIDNDCDNSTDEDFPTKGTVCSVGVGQCAAAGAWQCNVAKSGVECPATAGTPVAETCDYLDNDCDGFTDQTFKIDGKYALDTACGNCFTDCTQIYDLPNASGECDATGVPTCMMQCDADYYDLNGVPDDGCEFFLDTTAVYVSHDDAMAADDANCGLAPSVLGIGQYPCLTIQYGIGQADVLNRANVLVSNGLYNESVSLTGTGYLNGGISLKGGYRSDTWERSVDTTLTTIRGASGAGNLKAVSASSVTLPTVFEGFIIQGAAATGTGANSYAVWIKDSTSALQVRSNIVYAGSGSPGVAGSNGNPGLAGNGGSQGVATRPINTTTGTCWGNPDAGYLGNLGGGGGIRTCNNAGGGTTVVDGGEGGFTSCPTNGRQEGSTTPDAEPGSGWAGSGTAPGSGGPGGYGFNSTGGTCYYTAGTSPAPGIGVDATSGSNGSGGTGALNAVGSVSGDDWAGSTGLGGTSGTHGSGGGGGGGGAGNNITSTTTDDFGGGGGGGGSGGCGGFNGTGGNPGGGSFGIFVTFSGAGPVNLSQMPVLSANVVSRGLGGQGGAGGNGGTGGQGGAGGLGGPIGTYNGPLACIYAGGKGGNGGGGGHAGAGGGGSGGVSWDIFVNNTNSISTGYNTANSFVIPAGTATSGAGGAGGLSSNTLNGTGGNGVAGEYGNLKAIP